MKLKYFMLTILLLIFTACGSSTTGKSEIDFSTAFVTTWKINKDDKKITIPTEGVGYDYAIDWGDGTIEEHVKGSKNHLYNKEGTYTVKIIGKFPRIFFESTPSSFGKGNALKILSINQWGRQ